MFTGWLHRIKAWWQNGRSSEQLPATEAPSQPPATDSASGRLKCVILSDGVARTLFDDYQNHRRSSRREEEIGWVLLGIRQEDKAFALAALPAGVQREAGVAHVRFNSDAQALASRILRQNDKRLTVIGVVHTHPGSLRHPSEGDLQGDRLWVGQLRGEGVFGIGTADAREEEASAPPLEKHRQSLGELCFSWYALGKGDTEYRHLPVQVGIGADLARPLQPIWNILETHAKLLNRLCRQLARVQLEVGDGDEGPHLSVKIGLAEPGQQLRLLLNEQEARYYWDQKDQLLAIDPGEPQLDRAVYLILAEFAKASNLAARELPTLVES
jgi:proteasome lid subunit RPN8/RPN11